MKKLFVIFLFLLTFISYAAPAQENVQTRSRPYFAGEEIDAETTLRQLLDTAKFFDEKYPKEKITDDMGDDIAAFFPDLNERQISELQLYIREGLGVYRYFKDVYEQYKAKLLTPEEPPLIVEDNQYAGLNDAHEYMDADGNTVVITDIKTIVPYTNNPRDLKSVQAKIQRDAEKAANQKGDFDDLKYIASRIEFKKIPFYDVIYPNPLTGRKGIGDWVKKDKVKVRIISEQTGVKDAEKIMGLIHIKLPKEKTIIAADGLFHKPEISFARSENLKSWNSTLPMPKRIVTDNGTDWTVYGREVAVPVNFEVLDKSKPLVLRADVTMDVCDGISECKTEKFEPTLTLASEYTRNSSVATYIYQSHQYIPPEKNKNLKVDDIVVKQLPDTGKFIEIKLTAAKKVSAFQIFISSPDNIVFEAPRVNIDGKKITVRLLPLNASENLNNSVFEIDAILNNKDMLRSYHKPRIDNQTPPLQNKLSWALIVAAFFGGLLLNFMPCVFPVLSIKLLSLTRFGARQSANVRRNFYYTLLGIALSFGGLASFLTMLKHLGHGIGWGMQFQNPYFVVTMIFVVLLFLLSICNVISFRVPEKIQNCSLYRSPDSIANLLTGMLIVLMSTPCTAPYLGTAIGFALSGSIADIYCIMGAVGLGLALPYLLIYMFPALIMLIPTPGPWMRKLNLLMFIMLLLTLIWLFSVLLVQTTGTFITRLVIYVLLTAVVLWLNNLSHETEYEDLTPKQRQKAKRFFSTVLISVAIVFYVIAIFDGRRAYNFHRQETQKATVSSISMSEINTAIKKGYTAIVAVEADWCLTCKYNDAAIFNLPSVKETLSSPEIKFIRIDWTNYNDEVLKFMEKYRRSGLPFYILFSPFAPDGIVLPEILNDSDLNNLIKNFTLKHSKS